MIKKLEPYKLTIEKWGTNSNTSMEMLVDKINELCDVLNQQGESLEDKIKRVVIKGSEDTYKKLKESDQQGEGVKPVCGSLHYHTFCKYSHFFGSVGPIR